MPAVTRSVMRALEAAAFAMGWSEEQLLDLAGKRLGQAIARYFPTPGTAVAYLGKGHNAGDALVALSLLRREHGWKIQIRPAFPPEECAPLTRRKWLECGAEVVERPLGCRDCHGPLLLLDGLLGIGASGSPRGPLQELVTEMEHLRTHAGARVAAVDLPSGVDADLGTFSDAVTADVTFMIGCAKQGLLTSQAVDAVGALVLVAVEPLTATGSGEIELICPQEMTFGKSPRPFSFHKGMAGRVAVVAGSACYPGAAVLAATGALRGGAGLVTIHSQADAIDTITAKCPPEIIVRSYDAFREIRHLDCDALVIGCGLGALDDPSASEFILWLETLDRPAVIDADALNLIARTGSGAMFQERHVATPHPGEFRRLAPDLADLPRETAARSFADRHPCTLLLKGARTLVTRGDGKLWCNATGTPGMATGGQGDLLAGVIGARLARGDSPPVAAALGAWLCGRAAEIALQHSSVESLTPSDTARALGAAYRDWQTCAR